MGEKGIEPTGLAGTGGTIGGGSGGTIGGRFASALSTVPSLGGTLSPGESTPPPEPPLPEESSDLPSVGEVVEVVVDPVGTVVKKIFG